MKISGLRSGLSLLLLLIPMLQPVCSLAVGFSGPDTGQFVLEVVDMPMRDTLTFHQGAYLRLKTISQPFRGEGRPGNGKIKGELNAISADSILVGTWWIGIDDVRYITPPGTDDGPNWKRGIRATLTLLGLFTGLFLVLVLIRDNQFEKPAVAFSRAGFWIKVMGALATVGAIFTFRKPKVFLNQDVFLRSRKS